MKKHILLCQMKARIPEIIIQKENLLSTSCARILLYKADGLSFEEIADKLAISTRTVRLCISKFNEAGIEAVLSGSERTGRVSEIGYRLNMIESFFSKMTKQMLRGIHVESKQELTDRIYQYFDEVNRQLVVYHWKYKMDEINEDEAALV